MPAPKTRQKRWPGRLGLAPRNRTPPTAIAPVATVRDAGPLGIFVYNAGLLLNGDPLTLDPDAVDRLIDVKVRGAYHASVEAARTMAEGGRIILIGWVHGDVMPFPGLIAYGASKSALQSMARGLGV